MGGGSDQAVPDDPTFYARLLYRLAEARHWLPEEVGRLTLYQFAAISKEHIPRMTSSEEEFNQKLAEAQRLIDEQEKP